MKKKIRSSASAVRRSLRRIPFLKQLKYALGNAEAFEDLFWHDLMLADRVRMATYARAIETLVPRGSVVVDVGTGSGVLACLAAKRARKVYAIEHSALIDRARLLVRSNGLENVELLHIHCGECPVTC